MRSTSKQCRKALAREKNQFICVRFVCDNHPTVEPDRMSASRILSISLFNLQSPHFTLHSTVDSRLYALLLVTGLLLEMDA